MNILSIFPSGKFEVLFEEISESANGGVLQINCSAPLPKSLN